MARPKMEQVKTEAVVPSDLKPTVKVVHMHAGLDLIGSKTSINNRNADIYELSNALLMVSKGNNRKVVIPFANIRGYELI